MLSDCCSGDYNPGVTPIRPVQSFTLSNNNFSVTTPQWRYVQIDWRDDDYPTWGYTMQNYDARRHEETKQRVWIVAHVRREPDGRYRLVRWERRP